MRVGLFRDTENIGIPEESQPQDILDAIRKQCMVRDIHER
jgi:hypothetical protein